MFQAINLPRRASCSEHVVCRARASPCKNEGCAIPSVVWLISVALGCVLSTPHSNGFISGTSVPTCDTWLRGIEALPNGVCDSVPFEAGQGTGSQQLCGQAQGSVFDASFFFFFFFYFILFLAVLGLHCCAQAFSSCGERGLLFFAVRRLLIAVASLIVEHGL